MKLIPSKHENSSETTYAPPKKNLRKPLHENQLMEYVDAAIAGNVDALEHLLIALKDPLFRLALRMLGNFADAEDATQEVLIKITTALSAFERRSSIRTWAFRVAVNHLRDLARRL